MMDVVCCGLGVVAGYILVVICRVVYDWSRRKEF